MPRALLLALAVLILCACTTTGPVRLDPAGARAAYNRGIVHRNGGDLPAALDDFTQAIELDPTDTDARVSRGRVYLRLKRNYDAIDDFNAAIALEQGSKADTFTSRGNAYLRLGKLAEARADYSKAIELKPSSADDHYNRGLTYSRERSWKQAEANFSRALELNPKDVGALRERAAARRELGDEKGRLADLDRAKGLEYAALLNAPRSKGAVDLDDKSYGGYFIKMRERIDNVWVYPPDAAQNGKSGTVALEFKIARQGHVLDVKIVKTSGYGILDEAIVRAVRGASPFAPLPTEFTKDVLTVTGTFKYVLTAPRKDPAT